MPDAESQPSDESVALRAKSGDEAAFGEIFDRFYPEIYGFVMNQNSNFDLDAADVAQLVFVKAARKIHQLQSPKQIRAWLYQITRNCVHDARRKNNRDQKLHLALVREAETLPGIASSPTGSEVHDWIGQLDNPMRETVTLVYLQGLNHREAGQVMGCAEGTISWRVSEAVKTLRKIAERERRSA